MPVKRRLQKRRHSVQAEVSAWSDVFECEFDFFGELEPFGFAWGDDATIRAAAPEAWDRLGDHFLASWTPSSTRSVPWALEAFGTPSDAIVEAH